MKTELGYFTTQNSQSFPLDCELYETIQNMSQIPHIIGNVVGERAIIYQQKKEEEDGIQGYLFIRTENHPEGEVIWFEKAEDSSELYLCTEPEPVSAMGDEFEKAYTHRWLSDEKSGDESFRWEDFPEPLTLTDLKKEIEKNSQSIAALSYPPLGIIHVWAGTNIPENYALCDGTQYRQEEYPELYRIIAGSFNSAMDYQNNAQVTTAGYFRVPDLRSRFIVGQSPESGYTVKGSTGGYRTVNLSSSNMPSHSHSVNDYYYSEKNTSIEKSFSGTETVSTTVGSSGSRHTRTTLLYKTHNTSSAGSGTAHENRPPFYTLAYIIRMK